MSGKSSIAAKIERHQQQAAAFVGYDNFGGNDDNYLEGLRTYLEACENTADLTEAGQSMLDQVVVGNLASRLFGERGFEQYPECLKQPIVKPIIVVGLPRCGTSVLHKILASAPETQSLENWLASFPMPRPPRETWPDLEPYRMVVKALDDLNEKSPDLKKAHLLDANEPDECNRIFTHSFSSWSLMALPYNRAYRQWILRQDLTKAYQRHKKVLQLIGYRNKGTWVLKDPLHLTFVDIILKLYPDACIVHTCRDPGEVMASLCNTMRLVEAPYQKKLDNHKLGEMILDDFAYMMDRFMALRTRLDPARFLDVRYTDVVSDPVTLAKRIYRHFDIDIGADGESNLQQWLKKNKKDRFGKHHYTLEEYGLTRDMVNDRYAKYREQYL